MAFALSATPTAGTGTISIAANGTTVTGVGTNFTGQALNGKIILINGHNALVTAVASATSMTINRAPSFAISTTAFNFVNNGTFITQTGTDANPSGLGAITGIFNLVDSSAPSVQSLDLGQLPLLINGTLTIPDSWWLKATGGAAGNVLRVSSTGKLIIDARRTITRPEGSVVVNSLGCGIIIRKASGIPFSVNTIQFDSGSQFEQYGGIIETSGSVRWIPSTTSLATFREATWYVYDRNINGYMNIYIPLTKPSVDGWKLFSNDAVNPGFLSTLDSGFSIKGFEVIGGLNAITAIDGTTAMVRLDNFVGGFSRFDFQVRVGGTVTNEGPVGGYDFYNANIGNNLQAAPNATANNTTGRARHYVSYTPTFLDSGTSSGIVGGVLYQKDSNSGSRVTNNGVPNDKIYINTSGIGGVFPQIELLTKVWSGLGFNPMNQDNRLPINGYFWDYNQLGTPVNITSSIGPQLPTLYAPADTNVTLSRTAANALIGTKFTFDTVAKKITVIANASYDDLYDANKAFKCTATQLNLETPNIDELIITANGSDLEAYTGWALEVATGVTLSAGTKFKTVNFNTITNNGTITATYIDSTGANARLLVSGLSAGMAIKLLSGTTTLASTVATGSTASLQYFIPTGSTTLSSTLYVERATGQANGYNLYTNTILLPTTGTSTTAIMSIDTFYGRSSGEADRANVSVTWDSVTGAPTITLSGDANVKSVYDVVLESHATVANITYVRPTTADGFTYQFGNAIFTGTGRMTGTQQFFTTGAVSIGYDLILNYLNSINFLPNSWIKVIKSDDDSVLSPFALNTTGILELNMGTGVDYKVFLKKDGYKPVVRELNSGTGQALTINQPAQGYYNGATDISTLIPKLDVTNSGGLLSIVSVGEMRATSLEVCAIIDHLQKDEDFADVALFAETGDIWVIDSQYQNTPDPNFVKIQREASLTNTELTIWDTYFTTTSTNVPDENITPIQSGTGLWVMSNRSAVGEVTIKNEQAVAISQTASEYVWEKVLENGKTANRNVSQSNNFDAITSIEVQKAN